MPLFVIPESILLAILILVFDLELWWLAMGIFFGAIVFCEVRLLVIIPRWKAWAYRNVRNVHQLQRTAELNYILPTKGPNADHWFIGPQLRKELKELLKRFEVDDVFEDDPAIPATTAIYRERGIGDRLSYLSYEDKAPIIVLSNGGIETEWSGFVPWKYITDEHVANKRTVEGSGWHLVYCYPGGNAVIYLGNLAIQKQDLDLLLWLYRGRYETGTISREGEAGIFV